MFVKLKSSKVPIFYRSEFLLNCGGNLHFVILMFFEKILYFQLGAWFDGFQSKLFEA